MLRRITRESRRKSESALNVDKTGRYKGSGIYEGRRGEIRGEKEKPGEREIPGERDISGERALSLIQIPESTRHAQISYAFPSLSKKSSPTHLLSE